MFQPPRRPRPDSGFSTIEACVAVLILAALLALLLPITGEIRANSKDVQCTANLRLYYAAFMNYASDNRGEIPAYRTWSTLPDGSTANGPGWRQLMTPYLPYPGPVDTCPRSETPFKHNQRMNYGMNSGISGALSKFQSPVALLLLADADMARVTAPIPPSSNGSFTFYHSKRAHLLYMDGRIEKTPLSAIPPHADRAKPLYQAFWNGR